MSLALMLSGLFLIAPASAQTTGPGDPTADTFVSTDCHPVAPSSQTYPSQQGFATTLVDTWIEAVYFAMPVGGESPTITFYVDDVVISTVSVDLASTVVHSSLPHGDDDSFASVDSASLPEWRYLPFTEPVEVLTGSDFRFEALYSGQFKTIYHYTLGTQPAEGPFQFVDNGWKVPCYGLEYSYTDPADGGGDGGAGGGDGDGGDGGFFDLDIVGGITSALSSLFIPSDETMDNLAALGDDSPTADLVVAVSTGPVDLWSGLSSLDQQYLRWYSAPGFALPAADGSNSSFASGWQDTSDVYSNRNEIAPGHTMITSSGAFVFDDGTELRLYCLHCGYPGVSHLAPDSVGVWLDAIRLMMSGFFLLWFAQGLWQLMPWTGKTN